MEKKKYQSIDGNKGWRLWLYFFSTFIPTYINYRYHKSSTIIINQSFAPVLHVRGPLEVDGEEDEAHREGLAACIFFL